jgi:hypothetical protein
MRRDFLTSVRRDEGLLAGRRETNLYIIDLLKVVVRYLPSLSLLRLRCITPTTDTARSDLELPGAESPRRDEFT